MTVVITVSSESDVEDDFEPKEMLKGMTNGRVVTLLVEEIETLKTAHAQTLLDIRRKFIPSVRFNKNNYVVCNDVMKQIFSPVSWFYSYQKTRLPGEEGWRVRNYSLYIPTAIIVIGASVLGTVLAQQADVNIAGFIVLSCLSPLIADILTYFEENVFTWMMTKKAQKKHEKTIEKIQGVIKKLAPFGDNPFDVDTFIETLPELSLRHKIRREIVQGVNIGQLLNLRSQLGKEAFELFTEGALSEEKTHCLEFLRKQHSSADEYTSAIFQLQSLFEKDPSAWEVMARTIPEEFVEVEKVERMLTRCKPGCIESELSEIRGSRRHAYDFNKVEVHVKVNGRTQQILSATYAELSRYHYFSKMLEGGFRERDFDEIDLELTEEEAEVFPVLLHYIREGKYVIRMDNVVPLMILADRLRCEDCLQDCSQYFLSSKEEFDSFDFLRVLCTYPHIADFKDRIPDLLNEAIGVAVATKQIDKVHHFIHLGLESGYANVLNRLLSVFSKLEIDIFNKDLLNTIYRYEELKDLQQSIKEAVWEKLPSAKPGLRHLRVCLDVPELYRAVESHIAPRIKIEAFKKLWDFAITHDKPVLKEACLQFVKKHENNVQITNCWELGKVPVDILEVIA